MCLQCIRTCVAVYVYFLETVFCYSSLGVARFECILEFLLPAAAVMLKRYRLRQS